MTRKEKNLQWISEGHGDNAGLQSGQSVDSGADLPALLAQALLGSLVAEEVQPPGEGGEGAVRADSLVEASEACPAPGPGDEVVSKVTDGN